jgi:hypothetical protein
MSICTVKTMLEKLKWLTICNRRVAAFWGSFPPASHLIFSPVIYLSQRCTNSGICTHRWNKEFTLEQPIEIEPITLINKFNSQRFRSSIAYQLFQKISFENCFKRSSLRRPSNLDAQAPDFTIKLWYFIELFFSDQYM